jgi:hypothetical protein
VVASIDEARGSRGPVEENNSIVDGMSDFSSRMKEFEKVRSVHRALGRRGGSQFDKGLNR